MSKNCKKCGGTGRLPWTNCDGGACWACTGQADTSYTTDAEAAQARFIAEYEARRTIERAARRARRGTKT